MDRNHLVRKGFRPDAAVEEGGDARVGFAGAGFDVEKPWEAHKSTAWVSLGRCETRIYSDISLDGQYHSHPRHLRPHIPEASIDQSACTVLYHTVT